MKKTLLLDYQSFDINPLLIKEAYEQGKKVLISGVLQRANARNQNGRVYPKAILAREAQKYQVLINEKRALGELDHPDESIVNLSNVSHNIIEMHWEGNDLVGTIEVLDTPSGNILRKLLEAGIKIGISSRALGSLKETSIGNEVQDDLELIAFDMVSNPSTQNAFMKPLQESIDKFGQTCVNKYCHIQEIITEILINMD